MDDILVLDYIIRFKHFIFSGVRLWQAVYKTTKLFIKGACRKTLRIYKNDQQVLDHCKLCLLDNMHPDWLPKYKRLVKIKARKR